jgi:hypothetical protein
MPHLYHPLDLQPYLIPSLPTTYAHQETILSNSCGTTARPLPNPPTLSTESRTGSIQRVGPNSTLPKKQTPYFFSAPPCK